MARIRPVVAALAPVLGLSPAVRAATRART